MLHDLALEYLNVLRGDPAQPGNIKDILDYEEGRTLIDEAARSSDLVLREDLLKEARDKLEGFVKAHPQLTQTREALVQMAKLLIERGHLAMLMSEEAQDPAKKGGQGRGGTRRIHPGARVLCQCNRAAEHRLQEVFGLHP